MPVIMTKPIIVSVTKDEIRIKNTVNAITLNADDGRRKYGQFELKCRNFVN